MALRTRIVTSLLLHGSGASVELNYGKNKNKHVVELNYGKNKNKHVVKLNYEKSKHVVD